MKVTLASALVVYTLSTFLPASASLTLRFIITSARCCVASLSACVCVANDVAIGAGHRLLQRGQRRLDRRALARP